jgi:hypothetical protein
MVTVDVYAPSERMSLFRAAGEKLPGVHNKEGQLVTDGFLDVCSLVVPVIGMCLRLVDEAYSGTLAMR